MVAVTTPENVRRWIFLGAAASLLLAAVPGAIAYESHEMTAEEQAQYSSMTEADREQAAAQYAPHSEPASSPPPAEQATPPPQSTSGDSGSTYSGTQAEGTHTYEHHEEGSDNWDGDEEAAAQQAGVTLEQFRAVKERIQGIIDRFNAKREAALAELRAEIEALKGDFVDDKEAIVLECAAAQGWDVELVRKLLHGELSWEELSEEQQQAFLAKRESFEQCVRERCQGEISDGHERIREAEERARAKIEQAMQEAMAEWEALKAEFGLA